MTTSNKTGTAKKYQKAKLISSLLELLISSLFLLFLIASGFSSVLAKYISIFPQQDYGNFLLYLLVFGLITKIIAWPFEFYQSYILEHRYELSNQSFFKWLKEDLKSNLVGLLIFIPISLFFYYNLKNYPQYWWLPVGIFMFLFSILLSRLAPILIMPLFYKFTPLDNKQLSEKLINMCQKQDIDVEGVYEFDLSKNTKKANAAFTGIGKSKRIILGDTLLNNFSQDEIKIVFAHEVGHKKLNHIWKLILWGAVTTLGTLAFTNFIYQYLLPFWNFKHPAELGALPLFALLMSLTSFLLMPLNNVLSRYFERQADRFALSLTPDTPSFISSMEKLSELNLADPKPHPAIEFIFYSHPSISKRIKLAKNYSK